MSLSKLTFLAKVDFVEVLAASGIYPARTEPISEQVGGALAVATYHFVHISREVLSATGGGTDTATIDLWAAKTSRTGVTMTNPTGCIGFMAVVTGTAATCNVTIAEGASNGADLGLSGTTPKINLDGGGWCAFQWGAHKTVSNTAKTIDLVSTGSTGATVDFFAIVRGGTLS